MALAFGGLLILVIPLILLGGGVPAPSSGARRIAVRVCTVLSLLAGVLWLLGLKTLPLMVLAYVPAYQIELQILVMKLFRENHGREMELIGSGIITDPELQKDARYSAVFFVGALVVPMLLLIFLLA